MSVITPRSNRAFPRQHYRASGFILSSLLAASTVALSLFWLMYQLVKIVHVEQPKARIIPVQPFYDVDRELTPPKKRTPRLKLPPVVDMPLPSRVPGLNEATNTVSTFFEKPDDSILFAGHQGGPVGLGEREYMPLTEIQPVYPERALTRNLEGTCVVVYTITRTGSVENVRVDANRCTSTLFHAPSIKAAQKFKYAPRIVDGETIDVPNVSKRFRFSITD